MAGEKIIARKQELIETLNILPPGEERLLYLISLGKHYPPLPDKFRTPAHLLPGCVSQLWIAVQKRDDETLEFAMDADAAISKGIAAAVCGLYNGEMPADILAVEPDFLDAAGLRGLISPNRSNALGNLRKFILQAANEA